MFDPSHPVFRRWILYAHAYTLYIKRLEREVGGPWGLSVPQILTLYFLNWATDTVTPTALANYLTQEAQSVTSLLQRMEASGLIERRPNPQDQRSIEIVITAQGKEIIEQCSESTFQVVLDFFSPLSEEQQMVFEDMCRELRDYSAPLLGLSVERLDIATRQLERDPAMWERAQVLRDAFSAPR